jgi:hypothetical protein
LYPGSFTPQVHARDRASHAVHLVDLSLKEHGKQDVFHPLPIGRIEVAYGDLKPHLLVFALGHAEGVDHLYIARMRGRGHTCQQR